MEQEAEVKKKKLKPRDHIILAGLIGISVFIISVYLLYFHGGVDFTNILYPTRAWLAGAELYLPFKQNLDPTAVPYPFTAYLFFVLFAWMPDWLGVGIFMGVVCGILAWLFFRSTKYWYLLLFLSWPFAYNLILAQFAPYAILVFFSSSFLPFILFKPQLVIPFVLTQRLNRLGLVLTASILLVSLIVYPRWPYDWLTSMHYQNYIGFSPLFLLPLGPLLLLALVRYKERRAWILLFFALIPQRMVYDQLGVLLVAENRKQLIFLVICSWLSFPALLYFGGWGNLPFGWQNWVLLCSYMPALIVVLMPVARSIFMAALRIFSKRRNRVKAL